MIYANILDMVGGTPMVHLHPKDLPGINLYGKMESYNPTGSVKDRAASYILKKLFDEGEIDQGTTIIESSSGNFGISLAAYCREYALRFICVADSNISPVNEMLIRKLGATVIKVEEPDNTGGYLLNRIAKVKELCAAMPNSYWVNQYGNPNNADAYYYSLGEELCDDCPRVDYVFIGVSSGGTITGVSRRVKERFPDARIIAVDILGSVIFGGLARKRCIPGIGSSMVPDIIQTARIDDVVVVDEVYTIQMCLELLREHFIFAGGSSGSVFGAVKNYFQGKTFEQNPNVIAVFPDRGDRYANTVYSQTWCDDFIAKQAEYKKSLTVG